MRGIKLVLRDIGQYGTAMYLLGVVCREFNMPRSPEINTEVTGGGLGLLNNSRIDLTLTFHITDDAELRRKAIELLGVEADKQGFPNVAF